MTVDETMHQLRELYVERQSARDAMKGLYTDIQNKIKRVKRAGTRLAPDTETNECERKNSKHYILFEMLEDGTWAMGASHDGDPAVPPHEADGDRIMKLLVSFQTIAGKVLENELKIKELLQIA